MLTRAMLTLLVLYTVLAGATYDAILNPSRRLISVILIGAVLALWLWRRWRGGWRWHRTPLDWAILLWGAAFALSLLTNLESWRRISLGLWYMGLYVGIWYVLQDALANRALRREWLVDALLIAGVPVVFAGIAQVETSLVSGLGFPRPVGTLGNSNALAALLVLLIPFALGRLVDTRSRLARVLLGVYSAAILLVITLSFSRGGWFGAAVAISVWAAKRLPLLRWWRAISPVLRVVLVIGGVVVVIGGALFVTQTFSIGGRGLDLRTWIYRTAIQMFGERPLTGYGLFTFGGGLARINSIPPLEPHSHAHNLILNVAAEMGIVGLAALALTGWVALRGIIRAREPITVMGAAAVAGFVAHQMFDIPAMMPAIALVALVALVLVLPATEQTETRRWQPALVALGGVALTITGLWNAINYQAFTSILSEGIASGDYRTAAERLQPLADADSALGIYPQQQGILLGLAAATGDPQAAQDAAAKFERYTQLEPNYGSGWANLAAMYEALGEKTPAVDAMRHAVELAPLSWSLIYRLGVDAEAAGDTETARQAYEKALAVNTDMPMLPGWNDSPIRQSIPVDESKMSALAQALLLLESDDLAEARQAWENSPDASTDYSAGHVMNLIFALANGDQARAEAELAAARRAAVDAPSRAWAEIGAALLDDANFDQDIAAAKDLVEVAPFGTDWDLGANINYIQYLSLTIPRLFLPQVGYTLADQSLLHLLATPEALAAVRATTIQS